MRRETELALNAKTITTSRHAVERLVERFYGHKKTDVSKYKMIGEYMIVALLEEHPEAVALQNGKFYIDSYELNFIVNNGVIASVIPPDPERNVSRKDKKKSRKERDNGKR